MQPPNKKYMYYVMGLHIILYLLIIPYQTAKFKSATDSGYTVRMNGKWAQLIKQCSLHFDFMIAIAGGVPGI